MSLDLYVASTEGDLPYKQEVLILKPLENKVIKFILKGSSLQRGYLINASTQVDSLLPTLVPKLSFTFQNIEDWKSSDSFLLDSEEACTFYVNIKNTFLTELKATLLLNIEIYQKDFITEVSYHGDLRSLNTTEVLLDRNLIIDPVPEGASYSFLKYSNGESLILLDDFSAIPYTPWGDE